MRLQRLREELDGALELEHRAFPLRPVPEPSVRFRGTYREEAWRRCAAAAAGDGIRYTPWPHDRFPDWSLPALEAAKCVALQGPAVFEPAHLALYRAFFTDSRNIADPREVAAIVTAAGADAGRFLADYRSGAGRQGVLGDWQAARDAGVTAIPTVVFPATGEAVVGLADVARYRAAAEDAARC